MGSGRKRIELRKVEKLQNRRVTFTKRRQGMIKKAEQLSSLTGCRVAALFFSPSCLNPILHGDFSLLEQAAAAADSSAIHHHSTTPASLFTDCFQEESPSVGDNLVDLETLLLSTAYEDDQEEQELLHQMDLCKPLQMVNYHSEYYSNIEKNNNYQMTWEVGSSSRNTTTSNNDYLVHQETLLSTGNEDQKNEWRREELLQMDHHSAKDYHYSPFPCIEKNEYGAGGRDMGMVTGEVGSSSSRNTNYINNANGMMNEEAQQQQLALPLDMAGEGGADVKQLKQRFEAVRQSLLDKLMMADAALSLLS